MEEVDEGSGVAILVFIQEGYHNAFGMKNLEIEFLGLGYVWKSINNNKYMIQEMRPQWGSGKEFEYDYSFLGDTLIIDWLTNSNSQELRKYLPAPFELIYNENGQFIEKRDR
ncbi:MAG: hypothetical protein LAT68_09270 [Cyclobacteriaceae bacterium]|nr:hypothetical protein [Cyclobacteriaceae bacterium]MCH8516505.1 hypothetical protein [Cyclobacteriaceae bacterium]